MATSFSELRTLRDDGELVLRRGTRDGAAILLLSALSAPPLRESVGRLEHEYSLRDRLDPRLTAHPQALSYDLGRPTLVLNDPGGALLTTLMGERWEVEAFLRVAIGIAVALRALHARGIVHKDVRPTNVLVDAASGEAWLTGFGIASSQPRERQPPDAGHPIAGSLAYMAPEQTGRMNRSLDARSDLYAYGVTLYEMLTGAPPFTAAAPLEWIHCHVAKRPVPPDERAPGAPPELSAIVMKLLAKTPEDRYQTAAGVEADLRRCLASWQEHAQLPSFSLGERDVSPQLLIPEKLYGREQEIGVLLTALSRVVRDGTPELVLVSGYSGVGKSSVVHELHRALVPPRGLFASGKFDQYKRDIPYATLAQALQKLVRMTLEGSESELDAWRTSIQRALGLNGQLMVTLIPELELVIGKQAPSPPLPAREAQRRFHSVFCQFLKVFARPEHPLALFLDDLQWLDAATISLLVHLATLGDVPHLLLVGAYRDNEVDASHSLSRALDTIASSGAKLSKIVLAPLGAEHVAELVAGTLRGEPERATPLAELIFQKTHGNPFFTIQFLATLGEEGLLAFDAERGAWSWALERIRAKGFTENVVELMVGKLRRLPAETRRVLEHLACLGDSAPLTELALACSSPLAEVEAELAVSVRAGLVSQRGAVYDFLHDRIQEAAYELIPEPERAPMHLRIGRLLHRRTSAERLEESVFDIVNQLNRGAALLETRDERIEVARLNLAAAKRAMAGTAHASALLYARAGCELLDLASWDDQHALAFALELQRAECEFLSSALTLAEERLRGLWERAESLEQLSTVVCLQMPLYVTLQRQDLGVDVCLAYLARTGVHWHKAPPDDLVTREYERLWQQLGTRPIDELLDLPLLSDVDKRATLEVLVTAAPAVMWADPNLFRLILGRMVNLSLEHGNSDASSLAYELVGMVLGFHFGRYAEAYRFGKLGFDLVETRGLNRFKARVYICYGSLILPWAKHVRTGQAMVRAGFDLAVQCGDFNYANYSSNLLVSILIASGEPLDATQLTAERGVEFARQTGFGQIGDNALAKLLLIRSLRGLPATYGVFDGTDDPVARFEAHLQSSPMHAPARFFYALRTLQERFFYADYAAAATAAEVADEWRWTSPSLIENAEFHYFAALTHAAALRSADDAERTVRLAKLQAHHRALAAWAQNCPETFGTQAALVAAELAALDGRELEAERSYEEAIRSARDNELVHNEALAYELAARFQLARGMETIAEAYMRAARSAFGRWGAHGKVDWLDRTYPQLLLDRARTRSDVAALSAASQLDLSTVVKISQAVSGEIVLEKLVERLMTIALEHAGATRGLLVLPHAGEVRIEAEASVGRDATTVELTRADATPSDLPASVLRFVTRTKHSVILDDALEAHQFSADAYFAQRRARSVLCLPLVKQGSLVGILYLENDLLAYAFTPHRVAVLGLLVGQAAVALEQARLYSEQRVAADELAQAQAALAHVSRVTTLGELAASIAHEVNQPLAAIVSDASACLNWLAQERPVLEEVRQALSAIVQEGERAGDVLTRIRSLLSRSSVERERCDLALVIRRVLPLVRPELARQGFELEELLSPELPAVMSDPIELQQVLLNLLLNAAEASKDVEPDRRRLVIRAYADTRDDGPWAVASVEDAGVGFATPDTARLFDAFYTTKTKGLGMGLSISRSIIERHSGTLWAAPNPGHGVTFHFALPGVR